MMRTLRSAPYFALLPGLLFGTATPMGAPTSDAVGGARADRLPTGALDTSLDAPRGARSLDDRALAAHANDVVDYTLRATLDPVAHTIHGEGTIAWRNTSNGPVRELWLHLYLNAFKNERSAFFRERVGGRGSGQPEDWGWVDIRKLALRDGDRPAIDLWPGAELHRPDGPPPGPLARASEEEDETDVRVPLPRAIAPGEQAMFDVVFDDKLPLVALRTGYSGHFHMAGQWFPKIARLEPDGRWAHFPLHRLSEFYADFGTYDVTIDVPEAFTVGATGPLVESHVDHHRRIERHVQRDVHDFAWTAWDQYQTLRDTIDGAAVTLLFPPGYAHLARRELAAVRFALPYYSARYGHYPYDVLTVVHPPESASEAGGMEYPTLITSGGPWWTPRSVHTPEIVTIHELGHQWFYGLVATDELSWPLLDEGLDQFAEIDAMTKWRGDGSLIDLGGLLLSDTAVQAVGGNMGVHDEPVAQAASAFSTGSSYQRLVYARTAAIVETLARVYGDEPVARALDRYARRYRFKHPDPERLIEVFGEVMGTGVASTLRAAVFDKGWVDYLVDDVSTREAQRFGGMFDRNGKREKVEPGASEEGGWDSSVLVRRRGTLSFPVEVEMTLADGSTHRERWEGDSEWKRFTLHGASALRSAAVDPDDRVLIDMNLGNNHGSVRSAGSWATRTFERVTYWMELAIQAVSP